MHLSMAWKLQSLHFFQIAVRGCNLMLPNLFSLSVDPLLCKLEEEGDESQHCSTHLITLAFADDLVLLCESWDGMQIIFSEIL